MSGAQRFHLCAHQRQACLYGVQNFIIKARFAVFSQDFALYYRFFYHNSCFLAASERLKYKPLRSAMPTSSAGAGGRHIAARLPVFLLSNRRSPGRQSFGLPVIAKAPNPPRRNGKTAPAALSSLIALHLNIGRCGRKFK